MGFDKNILDDLAISQSEYKLILQRLGRVPNRLELGLFGSLWSEHCGYKHSKLLLRLFQSKNNRLIVKAGDENAGVVDIGDGLAIVFKIESHNHPSAVEPYEGAATGVGGIVRDILAMGARPIALLNSLRFGPLDHERNRYLFEGVVSGISGYGNCIGIPNIGGEVGFATSYTGNPLVNAMCIGLVEIKNLVRATSGDKGNVLLLVGSGTGRDGIHGASGLASRTFEEDRELRPTVQVGNPFLEKILIESCLEAVQTGLVDGLQDLGAAGLTSASVECASNGGTGIKLFMDKIPLRDDGMEPYEIMLSETQERMLLSVKRDNLNRVSQVFDKWDVENTVIGQVVDGDAIELIEEGVTKGHIPINLLTDPPLYRPDGIKPDYLKDLQSYELDRVPLPTASPSAVFLDLIASPNISSRVSVYRQYDHQVQTNTVIPPGNEAALLRIKGTSKGLSAATDGNSRACYLDPFVGGVISVAEACRNVSCTGAEPIALTNCLNFGNPENPEVYYQLEHCVRGIVSASESFDAPVISGNVSLYNETGNKSIYPTPVIGAVGLTENVSRHCDIAFKEVGDIVVLLGASMVAGYASSLAGSEYLEVIHNLVAGQPSIDIDKELSVQAACRRLISEGLVKSAHDCSDGGLAVAIVESSIQGNLGFGGTVEIEGRWDAALFGEDQSRIVVSINHKDLDLCSSVCEEYSVEWCVLGNVQEGRFSFSGLIDLPMSQLSEIWTQSLERLAGG